LTVVDVRYLPNWQRSPATLAENKGFIQKLRIALGNEKFDAIWFEGQSMPYEQVIRLVLDGDLN